MVRNASSLALRCILVVLTTPYLIFLGFWAQWWVALAALVALGYLGHRAWVALEAAGEDETPFRLSALILPAVVAFGYAFLSGLGTSDVFNFDHHKHKALFNDLSFLPWPAAYPKMNQLQLEAGTPVVYYFALYLPGALMYKLPGGAALAPWVLLATFAVPMFLFFTWLLSEFPKANKGAILLFYLCFSGLDLLGWAWWGRKMPELGQHLEWIPDIPIPYQSIASQFFFTPQHWVPTTAFLMCLVGGLRRGSVVPLLYAWSLMPLWSAYVFIGATPFVGVALLREVYARFRETLPLGVCSLVLLLPQFALLLARSESVQAQGIPWHGVGQIVAFFTDELLLVAVLASVAWARGRELAGWALALAIGLLGVIPFVRMPGIQDFVMRASQPSLVVLWYLAACLFFQRPLGRNMKVLFVAVVLLSCPNLVQETVRAARGFRYAPWQVQTEPQVPFLEPEFVARQYLGRRDSPLWTIPLRPVASPTHAG